MSRVRCPQKRCSFWFNGWCDADEIELDPVNLSCITFDEIEIVDVLADKGAAAGKDADEFEWLDDDSIFEEEMDESLYGVDDGDPELDDEEGDLQEEDSWPL
ncbi:MAG: hypothetical protein OXG26_04180 [Caldilineaceae bacterium]|nr:hypothetical protein [Caldilineaceae bacterium]MDE0630521.1 hypothetical protein [Caldilineaceae bacterium]MXZ22966.1 hypothetical protein [Caldilineaceae bacterium SB0665_bin_25]